MSEQREFNASTVQGAIDKAMSVFGVERDALQHEVLDEGSSGFLGLGARDARIIAVLIRDAEEPASQQTPSLAGEPFETAPNEADPDANNLHEKTDTPEENAKAEPTASEAETSSKDFLAEIRERVENALDAMNFDHSIELWDEPEIVVVNVESEDASLLIGHKGETIDALQYLINVSMYREGQSPKRVVLNCEGYRERRMKAVQGVAHRTAKLVSKEGQSVELPPMSPSERRAVHDYLKENPKVTSSSAGNEEKRHVVVSPI